MTAPTVRFEGRIAEVFGTLIQKRHLSVQNLVGCSVGAWRISKLREIQLAAAWLVAFQREAKTLSGLFR